jgi:hypothetical protein
MARRSGAGYPGRLCYTRQPVGGIELAVWQRHHLAEAGVLSTHLVDQSLGGDIVFLLFIADSRERRLWAKVLLPRLPLL